jgi:hypothetical protein
MRSTKTPRTENSTYVALEAHPRRSRRRGDKRDSKKQGPRGRPFNPGTERQSSRPPEGLPTHDSRSGGPRLRHVAAAPSEQEMSKTNVGNCCGLGRPNLREKAGTTAGKLKCIGRWRSANNRTSRPLRGLAPIDSKLRCPDPGAIRVEIFAGPHRGTSLAMSEV